MLLLASARDAHRERRYTDGREFKNTQRTTGAGLPQDATAGRVWGADDIEVNLFVLVV